VQCSDVLGKMPTAIIIRKRESGEEDAIRTNSEKTHSSRLSLISLPSFPAISLLFLSLFPSSPIRGPCVSKGRGWSTEDVVPWIRVLGPATA
jgi:hypothetical protein